MSAKIKEYEVKAGIWVSAGSAIEAVEKLTKEVAVLEILGVKEI